MGRGDVARARAVARFHALAEVPLTFAHDWLRTAALVTMVGLAIAFALDFTRRRRLLEKLGHAPQLVRLTASVSRVRRATKAVLMVVGASLVVASLARPQVEGDTRWQQRGIDVVIVMDYSTSMLARDIYPSRLARMTREVDALLGQLAGDRVGVVVFAGAAEQFPLTVDGDAAASIYRGLSPAVMPPGSDLAGALALARCVARPLLDDDVCVGVGGRAQGGAPLDGETPFDTRGFSLPADDVERAQVIVAFTDGEHTTAADVAAEVARAAELGIDVHFIGVGTLTGELVPQLDGEGDEVGWKKTADGTGFVTTRLEDDALRTLAETAGGPGHYHRVDDPLWQHGAPLVAQLKRLKMGDLDQRVIKTKREAYQWLLFPAFLALLFEVCLADRRRRRRSAPAAPNARAGASAARSDTA